MLTELQKFKLCLINLPYEHFPHKVVTWILYNCRFQISPLKLHELLNEFVMIGYNPFRFHPNSKEFIQVKNIIAVIDKFEKNAS